VKLIEQFGNIDVRAEMWEEVPYKLSSRESFKLGFPSGTTNEEIESFILNYVTELYSSITEPIIEGEE
jgi:hypothetical protein